MKLPIYQVDAFADRIFAGNPAAVVPLDKWLSDELLQIPRSAVTFMQGTIDIPDA